jgi:hypothetical protein
MKRVIALRGIGNTGKSSTLRMLYELLVTDYALSSNRINVRVEGLLNQSNTSVIVSVNGVRIGIDSLGDRPDILAARLRELEFNACAIIVCASRTAKQFTTVVADLERSGYEIEWIDKYKEGKTKTDWAAINRRVAEDILSKIEDLL